MTWYLKLIFSFLICTGALASKDLIIKLLFNNGVSFSQIIFYTGVFGLASSVILVGLKKDPVKVNEIRYQVSRMFIVAISGALVFYSFKLLSPTVINIGSKMTLPIMIILSSLFSLPYSRKEKTLAALTLLVMLTFFYQAMAADFTALLGLGILLLSTFVMIAEYMTLNHTVRTESPALISSVPSLSLIILGCILSYSLNESLVLDGYSQLPFLTLCGFFYFVVYYSGIIRYKILPPGLAEFPSLLTILIVWPVDKLFFGGNISPNTLVFGMVAIVMVGYIIHEHRKSVIPPIS
ncbi:hypothetical protein [Aeromonas jandaei]